MKNNECSRSYGSLYQLYSRKVRKNLAIIMQD
jgi:hypothetical protein